MHESQAMILEKLCQYAGRYDFYLGVTMNSNSQLRWRDWQLNKP